jgi:HEAT repeat protein
MTQNHVLLFACAAWLMLTATTRAQPAAGDELVDQARTQVEQSAASPDPYLRANAMEALGHAGQTTVALLRRGLSDEHRAVRFAALVMAGRLQARELADDARPKLADPDASVQAAARFALARCGQSVSLTPLSGMLASPEPTTRANAAMLLGMLGDRSAVPMLKELAATPMTRASAVQIALVRLQVAEALVQLGDEAALDAIRSGLYSPFDEVRVLAVTLMGKLGDRRMESALAELLDKPPVELQIAAAAALARLARPQALPVLRTAAESKLTAVRAQAAFALSHFPGDEPRALRQALLHDPEEQVRLAAAAAVLAVEGPDRMSR